MKTVAIIFYSSSGHTAQMAEAVQRGAASIPGTETLLIPIENKSIVEGRFQNDPVLKQITSADALIFGSPTYMGGVAAQFKAFVDATSGLWFSQAWRGKLAAGFTHSGSPSGDKLSTLQFLSLFAAQHSMIWVGTGELPSHYHGRTDGLNRLNSSLGVMGYGSQPPGAPAEVDPGDLLTTDHLGLRMASLAHQVGFNANRLAA